VSGFALNPDIAGGVITGRSASRPAGDSRVVGEIGHIAVSVPVPAGQIFSNLAT
jgi:hypothetical protein